MNDFDDLIGADVPGAERARLRGVHDLLVEAGPPPELPSALQDPPPPSEVSYLRKQTGPRKFALIAAAVIVLGATFTLGFATGNRSSNPKTLKTIALSGTTAAPRATAVLDVQRQVSGNLPMILSVSGLPRVPKSEYYVVWLVRKGQRFAPCGSFVISRPTHSLTVKLNAPYSFERGDTWVVTLQRWGQRSATPTTVLQPT